MLFAVEIYIPNFVAGAIVGAVITLIVLAYISTRGGES